MKSSLPNSCKLSCFFFLSTHLLGVFDTLLIREKNHLQTERHSGVSYLSIRRMKLTQKEKLVSSKCGSSVRLHTHTHTHTNMHTHTRAHTPWQNFIPCWDNRPHPERGWPWEGPWEAQRAGRRLEDAPRGTGPATWPAGLGGWGALGGAVGEGPAFPTFTGASQLLPLPSPMTLMPERAWQSQNHWGNSPGPQTHSIQI